MSKLLRILGIALLILSAIAGVLFYAGGKTGEVPKFTNHVLIYAGILAGLAAVLSLIFPLIQMITHPKKAKGSLIGILALVIVALVAYALASDVPLNFVKENELNVAPVLKKVGTGLVTMYILFGVGLLAILYTELAKVFK